FAHGGNARRAAKQLVVSPVKLAGINLVFFRLAALFVVAIARYDSSSPLPGAYSLASRYRYAGVSMLHETPASPLPPWIDYWPQQACLPANVLIWRTLLENLRLDLSPAPSLSCQRMIDGDCNEWTSRRYSCH